MDVGKSQLDSDVLDLPGLPGRGFVDGRTQDHRVDHVGGRARREVRAMEEKILFINTLVLCFSRYVSFLSPRRPFGEDAVQVVEGLEADGRRR